MGMHHISRSIPADLQIARRENISVAELLAFAVVPTWPPSTCWSADATGERRALRVTPVTPVTLHPGPGVDTRHEAAARH
jgi:hypothetical protein